MVDGVSRLFPVDHAKVIRYLPNGGADVVAIYPSYNIQGTIDEGSKVQLFTHRVRGNPILLADEPIKESWSEEEMQAAIKDFKRRWLSLQTPK
jgi:hypothetical protein